eukprot:CAMPEP_0178622406 /NCGR_PEP_ID=MMETSP0698-20121128/6312_1 /TAXON_ID=265572 /ORGANISM="Extubocellulus spinifer, Strain CCMP396" /LENGTH=484 /DNA_ID=CAMNT_0020261469 /DNA_START=171 /DNA_END=1626 /DNA_ORIENTATION=-
MTSYSDNSSVVSSSSAEAGTASSVDMVQSAALYFNNLRIASSDDDEPPGTPPSAIFRAQRTSPRQGNASSSTNHYGSIIRNSSSSSSRLPIPFRPSREFDDDDQKDTTSMIRPSRDDINVPFDPYGDDPVFSTTATTSGGSAARAPMVPLLLQDDDGDVVESASATFPSLSEGAFATARSTPIPRSTPASEYDDPPLEAPSSVTSASSSTSSANRSSSPYSYSPRTPIPIPQALTNYDECHPAKRSRVPASAKTSTQGVLAVQGAGIPSVNGAYKRTGRFDRVGMYTKRTIHHGRPVTFTIFRCVGSDFSRKWYLSIVSSKARRSASMSTTSHDVDLYTAPSIGGGSAQELPPETGWRSVGLTGSGLDETHNNKTPHCLWIPIHNKRAGSPSASITSTTSNRNGCGRNKRVKTQETAAAAVQHEATATTTRRECNAVYAWTRMLVMYSFPAGMLLFAEDAPSSGELNFVTAKSGTDYVLLGVAR